MVTFILPYMGEEIKSNAEKKMYDVLQELNMEGAYVLHSLGLPKHQSKIYTIRNIKTEWILLKAIIIRNLSFLSIAAI